MMFGWVIWRKGLAVWLLVDASDFGGWCCGMVGVAKGVASPRVTKKKTKKK